MQTTLAPHQQRVVDEKAELDEKRKKLTAFIGGSVFNGLDIEEQARLVEQRKVMAQYSAILEARIAAF